jgi:hypothetical protein
MSRPREAGGEPLSDAAVLELWDRCDRLGNASRALALLERAAPELPLERLQALPVSERDARILDARARLLRPRMEAVTPCPRCGVSVEAAFSANDIGLVPGGTPAPDAVALRCAGSVVVLRPVCAGDLAAAEAAPGGEPARRALLERAVLSIDGRAHPDIGPELAEEIEAALESLDPLASVEIRLRCPECDHAWEMPFDACRFFWEELRERAGRIMQQVARLAGAFHWSERDILAMSSARRELYLGLAEAWPAS